MVDYSLTLLKFVRVIFAIASIITGATSLVDPLRFSHSFGLPLQMTNSKGKTTDDKNLNSLTMSYISLMGIRQLATGIIILTFAFQSKWIEIATILAILGVLVACTDGIYISQGGGGRGNGLFHAIPGVLIAALACRVLYVGE